MSTATLDRPSASDGFTLSRIKEGDMAHAMITLSRQYSRPMDAVIRELATNALESHEAAGHTGPVEITLPGWDDLYLTITDHGLGLAGDPENSIDALRDMLQGHGIDVHIDRLHAPEPKERQ